MTYEEAVREAESYARLADTNKGMHSGIVYAGLAQSYATLALAIATRDATTGDNA